jgi:hypothetical protein
LQKAPGSEGEEEAAKTNKRPSPASENHHPVHIPLHLALYVDSTTAPTIKRKIIATR